MVELEHARALLEQMGLQTAAQLLDAQLEQSLHTQQTYVQFLNDVPYLFVKSSVALNLS